MANLKQIELKTFSSGIALVLACRLLNARHFAEEQAWEATWRALRVSNLRMVLAMQTQVQPERANGKPGRCQLR